jgi:biotin/methionine sulfoxide reductase
MIKRVSHCSHWGAYSVLVEDGRIVGVEPFKDDPDPSPIIHSVGEWAKPDRRILRPMVREGWLRDRHNADRSRRGDDRFVPVSWDEALVLVASEITRVAQEHGNESIFAGSYGWTSAGRFHHAPTLLKRVMNLVGGYTGHVDTYSIAAGPVILKHILGTDHACNGRSSTLDTVAEHSETLVVFGALTPRTAQNEAGGIALHALTDHLRRLRDSGKRIVHVSPVRDDMPDWVGAEWWPIKPNTDTALILGLAGEILKEKRHDQAFLDRYTSGSEALLDYLSGRSDGVAKTADWAAEITGLAAGQIRALSRTMTETRSFMTLSWSLQRAHHGEQPYWAALALAALTGQIGLPGGGVGYGYGSLGGVGTAITTGKSPAMSQGAKPIDSFIPVARISDLLLTPGGRYTYDGQSRTYPDIRLVYWAGGNPFHHHQDLNRLQAAWTRPETIIVQDPMMTATARRADILLPATTSLERNDIAGNRRSTHVVAMQKAIDPLGEARADFEIFRDLAGQLGVQDAFTEGRDEDGWIRHLYDLIASHAHDVLHTELPEFDDFWAAGSVPVPTFDNHVYLSDFRADPEASALPTESGRIVLGSKTLGQLGLGDCLPHPAWLEPAEWLDASAGDQLHLISPQPKGRLHSQLETGAASLAEKRGGREQAVFHPTEAATRGISDGDTVRLWNARGACLATARISDAVRAGVVVLPTGAWFTPDPETGCDLSGNPNVLTLDIGSSGFGQGCAAHTSLVRLEKAAPPDHDARTAFESAAALQFGRSG